MRKKKGFTLVELLAVIVILAVIALIAVPTILGVIDKARRSSLQDSAYGLVEAANLYYAQHSNGKTVRFDIENNKIITEENNKLNYKGTVKNGTVLINNKGEITVFINDGKHAAYKNYKDTKVIVVDSKTCTVPTNNYIAYLDDEATITEMSNQELTEAVTKLIEQVNILRQENEQLKQQVNNKSDATQISTLQLRHDNDITSIWNKVGTEDLSNISAGSISQILIDNNKLVSDLQSLVNGKVDSTVTNNLSSQLLTLNSTVNNHSSQINTLTSSLNNKANSSHTHDDRYYTETETLNMMKSIDVPIVATFEEDERSQLLSYTAKRTGNVLYIKADIQIKKTASANSSIIYSSLNTIGGFVNIINTYYPDSTNNYNGYMSGNNIYAYRDIPEGYYTIYAIAVTNMFE